MDIHLLAQPVTRRQFALGSAAGAALLTFTSARLLAAALPGPTYDAYGYPTLDLTVTDSGYEGMPTSTAAGRYLVKLTGKNIQQPAAAGFVSPPAGMSVQDALTALAGMAGPPPSATPVPGGAPTAGGTPAAGQGGPTENQVLPDWVYQTHLAGGPYVNPGATTEAVIDLTPGDWFLWGDDPTAPQKPVTFTVTGQFPAHVDDPDADITATLIDFAITLQGRLTTGTHSIKVVNNGAEPHFLVLSKVPDGMTKGQVLAMLSSSGTPAPGVSEAPNFQCAAQSIGVATWQLATLPKPGTYAALCFFPTAGTGVPHAMNGMIEVINVTG